MDIRLADDGDALIRRIADIRRTPEERWDDAYTLLQKLFQGYAVDNLRVLLGSTDSATLETGIWVLSELGVEAAPLLDAVEPLLRSRSRKVRYWAIDVVHASAGHNDGRIIGKALELLNDDDVAVRRAASYFLARVGGSELDAAVLQLEGSQLGSLLDWFVQVAQSEDAAALIAQRIHSSDRLERLVAVAAAARIAQRDRSALERAADVGDDEIRVFALRELDR